MHLSSSIYLIFFYIIIVISNITYASSDTNYKSTHMKSHKDSNIFRSWFFPRSSSKSQSHMKIMDTHTIFNFDQEIATTLSNTKELQYKFKQQNQLLQVQINHIETTLLDLIKQQKNGIDKSKEILENYILLFELCNKNYQLKEQHTQQMYKLFKDTHQDYTQKTSEKIKNAKTNSTELIEELLQRYDTVHQ